MATAPLAKRVRFALPSDEKLISPVAVIVENGELPEEEVSAAFERTRSLHRRHVGFIKYADLPVHDIAAGVNALCADKGMHGRFESLMVVGADYEEARDLGLAGLVSVCTQPLIVCAANPAVLYPTLAYAVASRVVVVRTDLFSSTDDTDARFRHDMDLLVMRIADAVKQCGNPFFNRVQMQGTATKRRRDTRMRWDAMPARNTPEERAVVALQLRRCVLSDTFLSCGTAVAVGHESFYAYLGSLPVGAAEVTFNVSTRFRFLFPALPAATPAGELGMVNAVLTHVHTGELLMATSRGGRMCLYWVPPTWQPREEGSGPPEYRAPPLGFKNACLQLFLLLCDDAVFW